MGPVHLTPSDLADFADIPEGKAEKLITDGLALAAQAAPCILEEEFEYDAAAKAIIRNAILRWNDAGSGAYSGHQRSSGPFQMSETFDTRSERRGLFMPSEVTALERLCAGGGSRSGGAFMIDTTPSKP